MPIPYSSMANVKTCQLEEKLQEGGLEPKSIEARAAIERVRLTNEKKKKVTFTLDSKNSIKNKK